LLVNFDGINRPICLGERTRVVLDIAVASAFASCVDRASPITAEGVVDDNVVGIKVGGSSASLAEGEPGTGISPYAKRGSSRLDIGGNAITIEEPDVDTRVLPLHGIDTTTLVIEPLSV